MVKRDMQRSRLLHGTVVQPWSGQIVGCDGPPVGLGVYI